MLEPADPGFERRVRESFERQGLMRTLGASLAYIRPGEVGIDLPVTPALSQQNGYVHAGALTTIADGACGYAAMSLAPVGTNILSVEFKINLLAPAIGERLQARGRVIRGGRTITVCLCDVFALQPGGEKHVALMSATMIRVPE